LQKLRPKRDERAAAVLERATAILTQHQVAHLLQVTVSETAVTQRRSGKRGRSAADAPVTEATRWQVTLEVERQAETIAREEQVAGWRMYVTNMRQERLTHAQAQVHYRAQWIAEHGYHRLKAGAVPALPLRVACAPLLRLALRHRRLDRGAAFRLGLLRLRQLLGERGKLLFQGGIFRLQLVDNMDGFFQGRWHGVSIPQFHPPKCEQLPGTLLVGQQGSVWRVDD